MAEAQELRSIKRFWKEHLLANKVGKKSGRSQLRKFALPLVGLEPARAFAHGILSAECLPFHHSGVPNLHKICCPVHGQHGWPDHLVHMICVLMELKTSIKNVSKKVNNTF